MISDKHFGGFLLHSILLLYFWLHKQITESKVTTNSAGAVIKLLRHVYSRNSEASVSNDGSFLLVFFFFQVLEYKV